MVGKIQAQLVGGREVGVEILDIRRSRNVVVCLQFVAAQRVLNLRKEFGAHSLVELSFPVFLKIGQNSRNSGDIRVRSFARRTHIIFL